MRYYFSSDYFGCVDSMLAILIAILPTGLYIVCTYKIQSKGDNACENNGDRKQFVQITTPYRARAGEREA